MNGEVGAIGKKLKPCRGTGQIISRRRGNQATLPIDFDTVANFPLPPLSPQLQILVSPYFMAMHRRQPNLFKVMVPKSKSGSRRQDGETKQIGRVTDNDAIGGGGGGMEQEIEQ